MLVRGYSEDEGSSNGSGKSSLARRSIIWVLFGVTPEGIRADDVVNRHTKGKSGAVLIFEGIDGEQYSIHRFRKPKVSLRFFQGENELTLRNEKETQKLIDQAIGRDATSFLQTNFFGQGMDKVYLDMTPKYQKEVIESILPIGYLDDWVALAKTEKAKLAKSSAATEGEVRTVDGKLTQAGHNLTELVHSSNTWNVTQQAKIVEADRRVKETKAEGETAKVEEIKNELEKLPIITHKIDHTVQQITNTTLQMTEIGGLLSRNRDKRSQWTAHKRHLEGQRVDLRPGVCPTCKQSIDDETHAALKEKQKEIVDQITHADTMISACTQNINIHDKAFKDQEAVISGLSLEKARLEAMEKTRSKLKDKLATMESNENYTRAVSELNLILGEENPYEELVVLRQQAVTLQTEAKNIYVDLLQSLTKEEETLSYWVEMFSKDMRNYLFAKACPFLESRTNFHLQGLGNPQINVKFSTSKTLKSKEEREDFNIKVWSETGGGDFSSLSGGEQQIVSFAVGLALADLAETQVEGKSHFLILDEPFIALDSRNYENIVQYLTELGKQRETILLISNDDSLISLIPTQVSVTKSNGVSRID